MNLSKKYYFIGIIMIIIFLSAICFISSINANPFQEIRVFKCGANITRNTILSNDLFCSDNALNINANNITLDCNGHSISAPLSLNQTATTSAFFISNKTGITIKNCKINGFYYGINLSNTTSSTFYNNQFNNNVVTAYEDQNSRNNSWNLGAWGNYWYDYDANTGKPNNYIISGPGNGIDNFAKPKLMNLNCGNDLSQSATLSSDIVCGEEQWVSLNILSDNITLDCNGHSIIGSPGIDDWGINIIGKNNTTIRNCNFSNLNFPIYHEDGNYNLIENNTFSGTRHGPILRKGAYNIIRNNTILNAEMDGIGIVGYLNDGIPSHHNQVVDNIVTNCGSDYASIEISYGNNNFINGNTITGTGQYDNSLIMLSAYSNNNTISNNYGTNGDYGFWIAWGSSMNTIYHNYIANSSYVGIYIDSETSSSTIYQNNILNSGQNNAYQETPAETVNWEFNGVGNYWGDHNCIDNNHDGVCENQYNFPGDSDFHPLLNPTWGNTTTTTRITEFKEINKKKVIYTK